MVQLGRLVLAFVLCGFPGIAQTGTVTFYSRSNPFKHQLKETVTPVGTIPFRGWLFDGNVRLAHASPGHFMTFRWANSEIEQVPCETAYQEASDTKPLDAQRVDPPARIELERSSSFPDSN